MFQISIALNILVLAALALIFFRQKNTAGDSASMADRLDRLMRDEFHRSREILDAISKQNRDETANSAKRMMDLLNQQLTKQSEFQTQRLEYFSKQIQTLTESNEKRLDMFRDSIEKRLVLLQEDNNKKLEKMRETVDEKLQSTLEKRLGESFKLVGDRLELVHKGLGEMKTLASGVGDLKKVLTNVKTRGTWGEVQLGNLLEQIMTPEQYDSNVATKRRSQERVEFAIKMPGRTDHKDEVVWLPIDAKCPQDPYQRLLEAQDLADAAQVEIEAKQLEMMIKREARNIRDKYLDPPHTTDFAVLFVPIEGMYAEVLRRPGLHDTLQNEYRVLVAGPTTLGAFLNSLQMGFKTLAIEKRSSEVWDILGKIKTEFGKFGGLIEKTKKKLQEAANTIEDVSSKTRNIERKLTKVQALPGGDEVSESPSELFELSGASIDVDN